MTERIPPRLGDACTEIVTHFQGVAVAITHHLGGRVTVSLQAPTFDGDILEFDIDRVRVDHAGWAIPSHMATGS